MSAVSLKHWTREEYDRLISAGILSPEERIERLEGDLVRIWSQNPARALAIRNAAEALRVVFRTGVDVRVTLPVCAGDASEPDPDVAVVRGHRRDFFQAHPATAVLIVEVRGIWDQADTWPQLGLIPTPQKPSERKILTASLRWSSSLCSDNGPVC